MEGISDGLAVDDCFICGYLNPNQDECDACKKKMRYLSAMMLEAPALTLERARDAYETKPSRDNLVELCEAIWVANKYGVHIDAYQLPSSEQLRIQFEKKQV